MNHHLLIVSIMNPFGPKSDYSLICPINLLSNHLSVIDLLVTLVLKPMHSHITKVGSHWSGPRPLRKAMWEGVVLSLACNIHHVRAVSSS